MSETQKKIGFLNMSKNFFKLEIYYLKEMWQTPKLQERKLERAKVKNKKQKNGGVGCGGGEGRMNL